MRARPDVFALAFGFALPRAAVLLVLRVLRAGLAARLFAAVLGFAGALLPAGADVRGARTGLMSGRGGSLIGSWDGIGPGGSMSGGTGPGISIVASSSTGDGATLHSVSSPRKRDFHARRRAASAASARFDQTAASDRATIARTWAREIFTGALAASGFS